jgi:hypothetical protein
VRSLLGDAGVRVVQTPLQAPNANAHVERFVRSIKEEVLGRVMPLGELHFDGPSQNSWRTTIVNKIIKGWAIG